MSEISAALRDKLRQLPKEPGCYLMKDSKGRVIDKQFGHLEMGLTVTA